ncbi:MAG: hypothetical protein RIQ72_435 [Candidatus Parcubacteria bacterium]|jgi:hypothetical protein
MPEETNSPVAKAVAKPVKKGKGKKAFLLLLSYVIVAIIVWQIQSQFSNSPERQQELARQEVQGVVDQVKEIMILPENEFPQMATVDNAPELAKTQAFFAAVENGDKVLIYLQDQKAIIYRPGTDKIVNVGPVVADNNQSTIQQKSVTPTEPKVTTVKKEDDSKAIKDSKDEN